MKQYNTLILIILTALLSVCSATAQKQVRSLTRSGNKYYKQKEYNKAEVEYRKALQINAKDSVANYDLANTLLKTDRKEEAAKIYNTLLESTHNKDHIADIAHNAGNVAMADKAYDKAVEYYKASLRARPSDEETRYNLALAQKLLQQQQNQGDGQNDDQNKQNEQDKDQKQDQDQKKDQKQDQNKDQQQNPDNQDQNKENKTQQNPSDKKDQMSKDNAQKILDAFLKDEKDTQRKIEQAKQGQPQRQRSNPKNW